MRTSSRVTLLVAVGLSIGACKQQGNTKAITKNFAAADACCFVTGYACTPGTKKIEVKDYKYNNTCVTEIDFGFGPGVEKSPVGTESECQAAGRFVGVSRSWCMKKSDGSLKNKDEAGSLNLLQVEWRAAPQRADQVVAAPQRAGQVGDAQQDAVPVGDAPQVPGLGGCFGTLIRCYRDEVGFRSEEVAYNVCNPNIPENLCQYATSESRSWCTTEEQIGEEYLKDPRWDKNGRCLPGTPASN